MEEDIQNASKSQNQEIRSNILLRLQIQNTLKSLTNLSSILESLQEENQKLVEPQQPDLPDYPLPEDPFLDSLQSSVNQFCSMNQGKYPSIISSLLSVLLPISLGFLFNYLLQSVP